MPDISGIYRLFPLARARVVAGTSGGVLDVLVCMIDRSTAERLEPQRRFGALEFLQRRQSDSRSVRFGMGGGTGGL